MTFVTWILVIIAFIFFAKLLQKIFRWGEGDSEYSDSSKEAFGREKVVPQETVVTAEPTEDLSICSRCGERSEIRGVTSVAIQESWGTLMQDGVAYTYCKSCGAEWNAVWGTQ